MKEDDGQGPLLELICTEIPYSERNGIRTLFKNALKLGSRTPTWKN
jgi:hypothetical protein